MGNAIIGFIITCAYLLAIEAVRALLSHVCLSACLIFKIYIQFFSKIIKCFAAQLRICGGTLVCRGTQFGNHGTQFGKPKNLKQLCWCIQQTQPLQQAPRYVSDIL